MKTLTTWLFIAATILVGLAGLSSNAQDVQQALDAPKFLLKVTTHADPLKHFAVTRDGRVLGVVCSLKPIRSMFSKTSQYSADLVFPNADGILDLDNYLGVGPARGYNIPKVAYRPFSVEDASSFCANPNGQFIVRIQDDVAQIVERREIIVQSFGVERRAL